MNPESASQSPVSDAAVSLEQVASDLFVQRLNGPWNAEDQLALERRLQADVAFANAYRRIQESWDSLDTHAEAPELMAHRAEALNFARRVAARRWLKKAHYSQRGWRVAASVVAGVIALAAIWQLSPYGYRPGVYLTDIGEQRILELDDHSRVALDAATKVRVRYTDESRVVELQQGQAQFSVARDSTRPFKVVAGDQTIVALGTVFTVEYLGQNVHIAMMEGRVAIVPREAAGQGTAEAGAKSPSTAAVPADPIELSAGQALRINGTGESAFIPRADIEAATAWRQGKIIIRKERLDEAVLRLNRYSHLQIQVDDPQLAARQVSGVFEAGDTHGFLSAIQRLYPVTADYSQADKVRLRLTP